MYNELTMKEQYIIPESNVIVIETINAVLQMSMGGELE